MKTITIENENYHIPENWSDVNLDLLMKISDLEKLNFDSHYERSLFVVSVMTGMTKDQLEELPLIDFNFLVNEFSWITNMPDSKLDSEINIDGVVYVPVKLEKITTGEMISLEVLQKDNATSNIPKIAAVLIRPLKDGRIEKLRDLEDINNRAEIFRQKLTVAHYWPIVEGFFYSAEAFSLKNSQVYLALQKSKSNQANSYKSKSKKVKKN